MGFTLLKKQVEKKQERFPNEAVMIVKQDKDQIYFELSKTAIKQFGYEPKQIGQKISWGYDDDNNIALAAFDGQDNVHTSNITAKNTFRNSKFRDILAKEYDLTNEIVFSLDITEEDGIFVAHYKERNLESFDEMVNREQEKSQMDFSNF